YDAVVVGGGPAGLAAANCAAECGLRVALVDDNPELGGQIWRASTGGDRKRSSVPSGVEVFRQTRVFHLGGPGVLLAEDEERLWHFGYRKLILATGARERFLPFPGWTLPNVMGAGGLQALVKSGLPIAGKRVVVAGSGPLLLAVGAYLRKCGGKHGAEIPLICEQASRSCLLRFGAGLIAYPGKIAQGLALHRELAGVRFAANSWPVAAEGCERLEAVLISRKGKIERIACDYLACGFHLVPNTELAALLGCQIREGCVRVDEFQQTSIAEVFCVGEPAGIGGLEKSVLEGRIAGLSAAGQHDAAKRLFAARRKQHRFARRLDDAFHLRSELKRLPNAETIVCRCEDVTYGRLREHACWRAAKLHTRCGMGPCQGRICGPAVQFLFGWRPDSVRPPIFPARFESLAGISREGES
ncbi:MAG: FAD-dependent oxidoreductase, partial [Candidatus Acidiferrales bacterium]